MKFEKALSVDPSESPFDNAQPVPHTLGANQDEGFGKRTVSVFFSGVSIVFILGFLAAMYLMFMRPGPRAAGDPTALASARPATVATPPSSAPVSAPSAPQTASPAPALAQAAAAAGPGAEAQAVGGALKTMASQLGSAIGGGSGSGAGRDAAYKIDEAKQAAADNVAAARQANATAATAEPVQIAGDVTDVINSQVFDETGRAIGTIYDILVDRQTGTANHVIVNNAQGYRGVDLKAVRFTEVTGENASGAIRISTDAVGLAGSQTFDYDHMPADRYVSLRSLEGGQVIDDQGKPAGLINAITYRNGSAQNIVFTIPSVSPEQKAVMFMLPFDDVNALTTGQGQRYIQLSPAQTASMAKTMLPAPGGGVK